jgi:hypothetical protein
MRIAVSGCRISCARAAGQFTDRGGARDVRQLTRPLFDRQLRGLEVRDIDHRLRPCVTRRQPTRGTSSFMRNQCMRPPSSTMRKSVFPCALLPNIGRALRRARKGATSSAWT